jgi:hypothetical protein
MAEGIPVPELVVGDHIAAAAEELGQVFVHVQSFLAT